MVSEEFNDAVSVVICSFNGQGRLGNAVKSVLDQDHTKLEVVVVDDGSAESLEGELSCFSDSRLRFFRLEKNMGLHGARAFAVQQCRHELIALLDDDDLWLPEKLGEQIEVYRARPDTGLVCCAAVDIHPDGKKTYRYPPSREISYEQEAVYECTIASSVLFRRTIYEKVGGFDGDLYRCGDWDCWIRLARVAPIRSIMVPLVVTHMRPESLQRSNDPEKYANDRLRVLKKHQEDLERENLWHIALSWQYHSIGTRYFKMRKFPEARKWLMMAAGQKTQLETIGYLTLSWPVLHSFYTMGKQLASYYKRFRRSGLLNGKE